MNSMPKGKHIKSSLIAGALAIGLLLSACGAGRDSELKSNRQLLADLGIQAADDHTMAVVINGPTDAQTEVFKGLSSINYQPDGEKMLFVPLAAGSAMRVEEITWDEARQDFTTGLSIYRTDSTQEGDALLLTAMRPEGAPALRVLIRNGGQATQYIIQYNGKTGTPAVESLTATDEAILAWDGRNERAASGGETEEAQTEESEALPASVDGGLTLDEIAAVFNMNEADIIECYGQPGERRTEPLYEGVNALSLIYDHARFSLDNEQNGFVYAAAIGDDRVPAPRDIKIGDSIETVISKFPDQGDATLHEDPTDESRSYRLLFGTYEYMAQYGLVDYSDQVPVSVTYGTFEGAIVTFELNNGLVSGVRYEMPLT
jgi:hypothetical protein